MVEYILLEKHNQMKKGKELYVAFVSVGLGSFMLGGVFVYIILRGDAILPDTNENITIESIDGVITEKADRVYASSRGTRYYPWWCGSNIKEENKVWFDSVPEAKAAGYTIAKNCQK